MKQKNFVDKSKFGIGPWQSEADVYSWTDSETGYHCVVWRNPEMGNLCGYVGIPSGHPLFAKNYDDQETESLTTHWGLTYSDSVEPGSKQNSDDFDSGLWYFGFDCAHAWDLVPHTYNLMKQSGFNSFDGDVYRDFEYVKKIVELLAKQLKILEVEDLVLRANKNRKFIGIKERG